MELSKYVISWRGEAFAVFCVNTQPELLTFYVAGESAAAVRRALGATEDCVELCALAVAPSWRRSRPAMLVYLLALFEALRTGRQRVVVWSSVARIADTYTTGVEPVYVGPLAEGEGLWVYAFDRRLALPFWVRAMWRRRLGGRRAPRREWEVKPRSAKEGGAEGARGGDET